MTAREWKERAVEFLWRKNPCWLLPPESLFGLETYTICFLFSAWCFSGGLFGHFATLKASSLPVLHICQGWSSTASFDMLYWLHPCKKKQSSLSVGKSAPTLCPLHFSCLDNRTPLAVSISEIIVTRSQGETKGLGNKQWTNHVTFKLKHRQYKVSIQTWSTENRQCLCLTGIWHLANNCW